MADFEMNGTVLKRGRPEPGETSIVLPIDVSKIAKCAFRKQKTLETVTMNVLVTEIGDQAFENCESLSAVGISSPAPGQTGLLRIGHQAFAGCSKLDVCYLPDGVQELGRWAFSNCTALADMPLPDSITVMYDHVFNDCESLRETDFPPKMTAVPAGTFSFCYVLSKVTLHEGVTEIGTEAFKDCRALHEIALPESLEIISRDAFSGSGLRRIRIPAGVQALGHAFRDCPELTEIEFVSFPPKGSGLRKHLEDILWETPELADAILRANDVPADFTEYLEWLKQEKLKEDPGFSEDDDRPWFYAIIDMLPQDDYVLIMDTNHGVRMDLFHVTGTEYTRNSSELFGARFGKTPPYKRWEQHFGWMMEHDQALRAYRYENGKLTEVRELSAQFYDAQIYEGCLNAFILRHEFGLEPMKQEDKAEFAEQLAKAEAFMQTLVYACYANDTPAIIARAENASKAALNEKFEYFGTPLSFCAEHDNLEGFRVLAEAGADLTKSIVSGTVSPLKEAVRHSPRILRYVLERFPDVFEQTFHNWQGGIFWCDDFELIDLMFSRYGAQGMECFYYSLLLEASVDLKRLQYLIDHHVDCVHYMDSYYKYTPLGFAELKYEQYPNEDHKKALELIRQEAAQQQK